MTATKKSKLAKSYDPTPQYFRAYKKLGGKHDKPTFVKNLDTFVEIIVPIYCYGECDKYDSREDAFADWAKYLGGDWEEAGLYFESIDSITALS
jgi:hypothetical protein